MTSSQPRAVALLLAVCSLAVVSAQPPAGALVLVGARILDVANGRYVEAPAVVMRGDRIFWLTAPRAGTTVAQQIDLKGATLVPGLADLDMHGAPAGPLDADFFYALSLAHGVTMGRTTAGRERWLAGQRDRARTGEIVAPRLWVAGSAIAQRAFAAASNGVSVADAPAAQREAEAQVASGADWLRAGAGAAPDVVRAVIGAAQRASRKVSVAAMRTSMVQAAEFGAHALDGIGLPARGYDEYAKAAASRGDFPTTDADAALDYVWSSLPAPESAQVAAALARRRIALLPLLRRRADRAFPDEGARDPSLPLLPDALRARVLESLKGSARPRARAAWDRQAAFVRSFAAARGIVVTGSGAGENGYPVPGAAIHAELSWLVRIGFTPAEAIRAATINAAQLTGADGVGEIKVGNRADLFAVDGDPLKNIADLSRIRLIVRGGEVLDRARLLQTARRATGIVK